MTTGEFAGSWRRARRQRRYRDRCPASYKAAQDGEIAFLRCRNHWGNSDPGIVPDDFNGDPNTPFPGENLSLRSPSCHKT